MKWNMGGSHLTPLQIQVIPTPRLLAYYKKHNRNKYLIKECVISEAEEENKDIHKYFDSIKAELDKREHIK